MAPFIAVKQAQPPVAQPPGFALWQLGFRPFYLLASAFAALSIGLWAAQFAGWLPLAYLQAPLWHAHEMLFGFLLAVIAAPAWIGIQLALDILLFIMAVMGGRVIPMFTNNGVPGANATRRPMVERVALGTVLALLLVDVSGLPPAVMAAAASTAALAHLVRWLLWRPWKTLHNPLVLVLHLAYAWIPVHLALRVLASHDWVSPSLATHALTVGAAGDSSSG